MATVRIALDLSPACGQATGVGRYVCDLASGLLAAGATISGVHQGHRGPLPGLPLTSHRYDLLGGRIGLFLRLPRILHRIEADLWHATTTIGVPGPGWRGSIVATVHDCWPLVAPAGAVGDRHRRLFRSLLGSLLERASACIVPSRATADELRAQGWTAPLHVIPHGIAIPDRLPPRPSQAPPWPYVLTIGAIEPRKRFSACAATWDRHIPWLHIGPLRHDPDGRITRAMDEAGCRRLGWVDDAHRIALLAHAAALLLPSVSEGFGYPALEAMALGVPVIATPGGALAEVLGDSARWIAQPEQASAVAATLLEGGADSDALRKSGRERARSFSIPAMVAAHQAVYASAGRPCA